MGELQRARCRRSVAQGSQTLSQHLSVVTKPGARLGYCLFVCFLEVSFHRHDGLNPWPLLTDSMANPYPLPRGQG